MPKLLIYADGALEREIDLTQERLRIGRKSHNDVRLSHAGVSGEHALVITVRDESFIEDLNSTNGVRVNGRLVKKCVLKDGDSIAIGDYVLKYVAQRTPRTGDTAAGFASSESDTLLSFGEFLEGTSLTQTRAMGAAPAAETSGARADDDIAGSSPSRAALQILTGPSAGKELDLSKSLTTLGKPGQQVAVITRRASDYFFTHVDGAEAPRLNGIAVGGQSLLLKNRDIIELAGIRLEFFLKP
ncbi:MAG: FHA domain-containing protein [Betaproteobacteria bacterium]|nr:FHA domain-containing protein [Betaproteobacteria bacterium]